MAKFHNPYHFVPVEPESYGKLAYEAIAQGLSGHVTHERHVPETFSGRIICQLTTVDPVVLGGRQTHPKDDLGRVEPVRRDGRPIIPASSLRGLIASTAEATSNSAPRVLHDRALSYRVAMTDQPLSALGMIVVEQRAGKEVRSLRPLTLPTLTRDKETKQIWLPSGFDSIFDRDAGGLFGKDDPSSAATCMFLKVYVGYYEKTSAGDLGYKQGSFLQINRPTSTCADQIKYWYMRLPGRFQVRAGSFREIKHFKGTWAGNALLGQTSPDEGPLSREQFDKLAPNVQNQYKRGILRVLGIDFREKELPSEKPGKTKEIFIPYPRKAEQWKTIPISEPAWNDFHAMAAERTESMREDVLRAIDENPALSAVQKRQARRMTLLPFSLIGSERNESQEKWGDKVRLRTGDLVFFRPSPDGKEIIEISISSIWRRTRGQLHDFFRAVSGDHVPFHPGRNELTIAEQLFGVVEMPSRPKEPFPGNRAARSLASRVRFSDGVISPETEGPYFYGDPDKPATGFALQILSSPKPPCPSFYFKPKPREEQDASATSGGNAPAYIAKPALDPSTHWPQGRKAYLHRHSRPQNQNGHGPWETSAQNRESHKKQKVMVWPIQVKSVFHFHIDFDNLSREELALLCRALAPDDQYHHKLGLGKPLGLGTVKIEPVGIFHVQRTQRYQSDALDAPRYHGACVEPKFSGASLKALDWKYPCEAASETIGPAGFPNFGTLRDEYQPSPAIAKALQLLGAKNSPQPVSYPRRRNSPNPEDKLFQWFVNNERSQSANRQGLRPITENTIELPTLEEN